MPVLTSGSTFAPPGAPASPWTAESTWVPQHLLDRQPLMLKPDAAATARARARRAELVVLVFIVAT